MKPFPATVEGFFISRPNRFVVECSVGDKVVRAYLPNPGRLWELLFPGSKLYLVKHAQTSDRSTLYMAVAVERDGVPILLHTHLNNAVARNLIENNLIPGLEGAVVIRPEITIGHSRFDFLLQKERSELVLEVKSCTLVSGKIAMFPDAITVRGRRHLLELASLSRKGRRTAVVFVVHAPAPEYFMPDYHTDLEFSRALLSVKDNVMIKAVSVEWENGLVLGGKVRELRIPWDLIRKEARDSGSYIVVLRLSRDRRLKIGGLGEVLFKKGYYLYAGSAKKNFTQRIARHRTRRKTLFWHIDYLREYADFVAALPVRASEGLECDIAKALGEISSWRIPGFGSSDCSCESHLFGMPEDPVHSREFIKILLHFRIDRLEKYLESR
jgi:sugar fermentation stimulation protein A